MPRTQPPRRPISSVVCMIAARLVVSARTTSSVPSQNRDKATESGHSRRGGAVEHDQRVAGTGKIKHALHLGRAHVQQRMA